MALLEAVTASQPLAPAVAREILAMAGGNPLALVELPGALSGGQRAGGVALPRPLPPGEAIVEAYRRRRGATGARGLGGRCAWPRWATAPPPGRSWRRRAPGRRHRGPRRRRGGRLPEPGRGRRAPAPPAPAPDHPRADGAGGAPRDPRGGGGGARPRPGRRAARLASGRGGRRAPTTRWPRRSRRRRRAPPRARGTRPPPPSWSGPPRSRRIRCGRAGISWGPPSSRWQQGEPARGSALLERLWGVRAGPVGPCRDGAPAGPGHPHDRRHR